MADKFYTVLDFMVEELQLKGLERDIYAIIYGFCQAGKTYTGSLQYLANWTLTTKQGVLKVLKKLEEKGLLIKEEKYINNVKFNEYMAVRPKVNTIKQSLTPLNNVEQGIKQSLMGYETEFNGGIKQSLPNNINNNKVGIKNDNKDNLDTLITAFDFSEITEEELNEALKDFEEMRKKIKKPLTERAKRGIIKKLYDLSGGNASIAVEILDNSIMNSWQGIFELKQDPKAKQQAAVNSVNEYPF